MSRRLLVWGASGHGRVVAEAALASGWELLGWVDANPHLPAEILGRPVVATELEGARRVAEANQASLVVAIGDNAARRRILEAWMTTNLPLATIVHPSAVLSPSATLGPGTVVLAGVVVNAGAAVGAGVILNTSCSVDHDCVLGDHCHLSPGVHLGGTVAIGAGCHLGVGVSVRNNLAIGEGTLVGVGAAVVDSLPAHVVAWGVPARVHRRLSP